MPALPPSSSRVDRWHRTFDRIFLGERFWANPMEDWRVRGGAAELVRPRGERNVHVLTHRLAAPARGLRMSVELRETTAGAEPGRAGFRIGCRSDVGDVKSSCFETRGTFAGVAFPGRSGDGRAKLVLRDAETTLDLPDPQAPLTLLLEIPATGAGARPRLRLTALDVAGAVQGQVETSAEGSELRGNLSLVANAGLDAREGSGQSVRFRDWRIEGSGVDTHPEEELGPILWTMYSLSDARSDEGFVLRLTALLPPLGERDAKTVELQARLSNVAGGEAGSWRSLGKATLDPDAWTATFQVPRWDATTATPFRVLYRERLRGDGEITHTWDGTVRPSPSGRPLRMAALTCQHHSGFPYAPVAQKVAALDADLLFFAGDQLYESHGGFGLVRDPADAAILNYLRKYYMFGWSFREVMRERPTLCIPDDHDVFQGNIWGEGGRAMARKDAGTSSLAGYREPARMVNVVHRTQASHHPEPDDPTPALQGISVYYGEVVYGGVSFAVLADRQFKSGPEHVDTGSGRADHVLDDSVDTRALDLPGLDLLGARQERFLERWAGDWRGHTLKVALSQTVFAGVATHHGRYADHLHADLDCGGWPQTARNRAVRLLRRARCLHVSGDQHLPSLVQYGVDQQRDAGWAFCVPAISVGYPRWWRPDEVGMPHARRPAHGLPNTGEYADGLGNLAYVYAIGSPEVASESHRYLRAHQKGSGFGLVTLDPAAQTYTLEAFRFLSAEEVAAGGAPRPGSSPVPFPGWPLTVAAEATGRTEA